MTSQPARLGSRPSQCCSRRWAAVEHGRAVTLGRQLLAGRRLAARRGAARRPHPVGRRRGRVHAPRLTSSASPSAGPRTARPEAHVLQTPVDDPLISRFRAKVYVCGIARQRTNTRRRLRAARHQRLTGCSSMSSSSIRSPGSPRSGGPSGCCPGWWGPGRGRRRWRRSPGLTARIRRLRWWTAVARRRGRWCQASEVPVVARRGGVRRVARPERGRSAPGADVPPRPTCYRSATSSSVGYGAGAARSGRVPARAVRADYPTPPPESQRRRHGTVTFDYKKKNDS